MLPYTLKLIITSGVLVLSYLVFLIFKPFATSLIFAGVIVVLFYPMHRKLLSVTSNVLASLISTFTVLFIIIIPALIIAIGIGHETINIANTIGNIQLDNLFSNVQSQISKMGLDLDALIRDAAQGIAGQAGKLASQVIGNLWAVLIGTLVSLFAIFFFFRDGENALDFFLKLLPVNRNKSEKILAKIGLMIKSNIAVSFLAASIQGLVGGFTFALLGLPAPILWGSVMAFFSLFPFFGSWLVWAPTAIGLIITGNYWDAIILIFVGAAIVHPVDNILRPAIVASTTHINGLLILIGLLGGINAFGVSGLLLGPVLVIIAVTLLETSKK